MEDVLARYRNRLAVIYLRQSTEHQVVRNVGSRQYQEQQIEHARRLGWAENKLHVIRADLGRSGLTTDKRPGYLELQRLLREDKVGGIFVSEMSRGGRKEQPWFDLLDLLEEHDALLLVDGRVTNPHDSAQIFVRKIEAVTIARENRVRAETVHRGRLAKARGGAAVSAPPVGYLPDYETREGVPVKSGRWTKDPSHRDRIDAIFAAFREARSLPKAVRALRQQGIQVPSTRRSLVAPTVANVSRFIKHPAYCGSYIYGRKHWQRARAGQPVPPAHQLFRQHAELRDHHEPYITREEYEANQVILALNYNAPWRSTLGPGPALLPGRIRCAHHGAMAVAYSGTGIPTRWSFRCQGEALAGGPTCASAPGRLIEDCVVRMILETLRGPLVPEARQCWREREQEWKHSRGGLHREIERVERQVTLLKRRLLEPDEGRLAVRAMIEDEYEKCADALSSLKARAACEPSDPDPFTEESWNELVALASNIEAIWNAPTTESQDRQQVVRLLVSAVVLDHVDAGRIDCHIDWADGTAPTRIEILRPAHFHQLILERAEAGASVDQIVAELADLNARTQQNRPWSTETVQRTLWQLRNRPNRSSRRAR